MTSAVHALPEQVRRVYVGAYHVADRRTKFKAGGGIVYAETGVHFERYALYSVFCGKRRGTAPIGNEHLVPLPFEHAGIFWRPCAGHPGGHSSLRVGAGTARKGYYAVDSYLTCEHTGGAEVVFELLRRRFVGMHAVAVHGERRYGHIVPRKS